MVMNVLEPDSTRFNCVRALRWLALLLMSSSFALQAAVTEAWVALYGGGTLSAAYARAMTLAPDGSVIVTGAAGFSGQNFNFYTIKYGGSDGRGLWARQYNNPTNGGDFATAIAVTKSGDVVVTGFSNIGNPTLLSINYAYYTARYAGADGSLLWENIYDNPAHQYEIPGSVCLDEHDDVFVAGTEGIVKFSGITGAILWTNRSLSSWAVTTDGNNDAIVTGPSGTTKYAGQDGSILWQHTSAYLGLVVKLDRSGNPIVAGARPPPATFYTVKLSAGDGMPVWEQGYTNANSAIPAALAVDRNDDVLVAGGSVVDPYSDYYTVKYSGATGAKVWERIQDGPGHLTDTVHALAVDPNDNVVISGVVELAVGAKSYYTAKYAGTNGATLWEQVLDHPSLAGSIPCTNCIAISSNGTVFVAGTSRYNAVGGNPGFLTVAYSEALPRTALAKTPTGALLTLTGVSGRTYRIERATSPTGLWATNAILIALTNGPLEYLDTNAPPGSAFYRTSTEP